MTCINSNRNWSNGGNCFLQFLFITLWDIHKTFVSCTNGLGIELARLLLQKKINVSHKHDIKKDGKNTELWIW